MIREGSNPLYDNFAVALLFRPAKYQTTEIRKISGKVKRVFTDDVWKFVLENKGCCSRDVEDYFDCTMKIATEHLCRLHKNNRVIRRGTKGKYKYEAIK